MPEGWKSKIYCDLFDFKMVNYCDLSEYFLRNMIKTKNPRGYGKWWSSKVHNTTSRMKKKKLIHIACAINHTSINLMFAIYWTFASLIFYDALVLIWPRIEGSQSHMFPLLFHISFLFFLPFLTQPTRTPYGNDTINFQDEWLIILKKRRFV